MAQSIPTHIPQWSNSTEIPNQRSKTGPSLAVFDGVLHMVHLGDSSDDIWHSKFEAGAWTENQRIDIKSRGIVAYVGQPDPAALGFLIYLGVNRAADGSYPLMFSPCGSLGIFGAGNPLPGNFTSNHTPAATYLRNDLLMVVSVVGTGTELRYALYDLLPLPSLAHSALIKNQTTKTGPALATYMGDIHLLHLGSGSNNIWRSLYLGDRDGFSINTRIEDQASQASPSMAVFGDTLHMVHLGSGSDKIWHSTFDRSNNKWRPNVLVPGQTSSSRPALAATADALHLVHKGAGSNRLWHCTYR
jgi:hypothetical protein